MQTLGQQGIAGGGTHTQLLALVAENDWPVYAALKGHLRINRTTLLCGCRRRRQHHLRHANEDQHGPCHRTNRADYIVFHDLYSLRVLMLCEIVMRDP
jgi:hypothetical protein